jgi:glycosyltransferase involved in cell wall biosynthesis
MVYIPMPGPVTEMLDKYNIPYEIHRYVSWRTQDRGLLRNIMQSLMMLLLNFWLSIKLLSKVRKFDLIYSNSSKVVLGAFFKFFTRKPLVWHLREFGTVDYPMIFLVPRKIVAKVFAYADVCVAISKEIEMVYRSQFSPSANYRLVYNGVELSDYQVESTSKAGDIIRICMVGGFSESKNQRDLIEAIYKLDSEKFKFHVDFFGDHHTEYGKEMEQLIKKYNCNSTISFMGQTPNLNQILHRYHIGIITSKYEAFGRVVIEYILSNLTVIASNTGACTELVKDGETGLLYRLGDSSDLAAKIKLLLDNQTLLNELSKRGRQYAIANYTAKINAQRVAEIIQTL